MLLFSPEDPFPLLEGEISYEEEKLHSALVDAWLGLRVEEVERELVDPKDGAKRWITNGPAIFQTPYTELRFILKQLKASDLELVVDFGAAYGRLGFVLHQHHPQAKFLGFELVEERAREGARVLEALGAKAELLVQDLSREDFRPPSASAYFIYDFGSRPAVAKILRDLRDSAREQKIVLIGRGREIRDQVEREHPWLTVHEPEHFPNFSVYRS